MITEAKRKFIESLSLDGKTKSFGVSVTKYYTDVDGQIIDKSTIPDILKKKVPFYMFGGFDLDGSYNIGNLTCPPQDGMYFQKVMTVPTLYLAYTGLNDLKKKFRNGDIVTVYADDPTAPTYFIWIVVSAESRAMNSITQGLNGSHMVKSVVYTLEDSSNYLENLWIVSMNDIGDFQSDAFEPQLWNDPNNALQDFILMKIRFVLSQFLGFYGYIKYEADSLFFVFNTIKK